MSKRRRKPPSERRLTALASDLRSVLLQSQFMIRVAAYDMGKQGCEDPCIFLADPKDEDGRYFVDRIQGAFVGKPPHGQPQTPTSWMIFAVPFDKGLLEVLRRLGLSTYITDCPSDYVRVAIFAFGALSWFVVPRDRKVEDCPVEMRFSGR